MVNSKRDGNPQHRGPGARHQEVLVSYLPSVCPLTHGITASKMLKIQMGCWLSHGELKPTLGTCGLCWGLQQMVRPRRPLAKETDFCWPQEVAKGGDWKRSASQRGSHVRPRRRDPGFKTALLCWGRGGADTQLLPPLVPKNRQEALVCANTYYWRTPQVEMECSDLEVRRVLPQCLLYKGP